MAHSLSRMGLRELTLVDPDRVETYNVGEMDGVYLDQVGWPKVAAVARVFQTAAAGLADSLERYRIEAVGESILSLAGLEKAKGAEVIFCCVDDAAARLAVSFLAAVYLRPLFDVGTGIFRGSPARQQHDLGGQATANDVRRLGADIRLLLPGEHCLYCLGGIAGFPQVRDRLLDLDVNEPREADAWQRERAGSLRSLNAVATHLAIRMLEDFIGERLRESTWLRLDVDQSGIPAIVRNRTTRTARCPLCALAGQGDQGLPEFRSLVERL